MSETLDSKKVKERSPAFPFITLERALERARQFYNEEKRGAAPLSRAVMHWQYSPGSSGGLQTIAALKQYGLLDDVGGSGSSRQLKLSELALRILLDQREDATERDANIRGAALMPAVAGEIFNRWSDGLPSDSTLLHFLIVERRFSEVAASGAVKILKENQSFAKFSSVKSQSDISESENEMIFESPVMTAQYAREDAAPRVTAARGLPPPVQSPSSPGYQRVLAHMGVGISLSFTEEPTKEIFDYLARYCAFEKENVPSKADAEAIRGLAGRPSGA